MSKETCLTVLKTLWRCFSQGRVENNVDEDNGDIESTLYTGKLVGEVNEN